MKSSSPEGRQLLMDHNNLKETIVRQLGTNPKALADEIEKLTFVTLRRFRALFIWPIYDLVDEDDL